MEIKKIKIGLLFYVDPEKNFLKVLIHFAKPAGYELEIINLDLSVFLDKIERWNFLATSDLDIIILPLSLYNYTSLKIAEDIHLLNSSTKTMLISGTLAPDFLLNELFDYFKDNDGVMNPNLFYDFIKKKPERINSKEKLNSLIAAILSTAHCFHHKSHNFSTVHNVTIPVKFDEYKQSDSRAVKNVIKEIKNPLSVFISYSHKDEEYKNQLLEHLSLLKKQGIIKIWHDRMINAGDNWDNEININLVESEIIIFLVSPSLISSDYCYGKEVKTAFFIKSERPDLVKIIPILIRPTDLVESPFSDIQIVPRDKKAISTWNNKDEAWVNVVHEIRTLASTTKNTIEEDKEYIYIMQKEANKRYYPPKTSIIVRILNFFKNLPK